MKFSKWIVSLIIIMNIIFTGVVLYIFFVTYSEPYTLIGAWFGFTTVELWSLASIKKKEVSKEEKESEIYGQFIAHEGDMRGE